MTLPGFRTLLPLTPSTPSSTKLPPNLGTRFQNLQILLEKPSTHQHFALSVVQIWSERALASALTASAASRDLLVAHRHIVLTACSLVTTTAAVAAALYFYHQSAVLKQPEEELELEELEVYLAALTAIHEAVQTDYEALKEGNKVREYSYKRLLGEVEKLKEGKKITEDSHRQLLGEVGKLNLELADARAIVDALTSRN